MNGLIHICWAAVWSLNVHFSSTFQEEAKQKEVNKPLVSRHDSCPKEVKSRVLGKRSGGGLTPAMNFKELTYTTWANDCSKVAADEPPNILRSWGPLHRIQIAHKSYQFYKEHFNIPRSLHSCRFSSAQEQPSTALKKTPSDDGTQSTASQTTWRTHFHIWKGADWNVNRMPSLYFHAG